MGNSTAVSTQQHSTSSVRDRTSSLSSQNPNGSLEQSKSGNYIQYNKPYSATNKSFAGSPTPTKTAPSSYSSVPVNNILVYKDMVTQTTVTYNCSSSRWKNNIFVANRINLGDFIIGTFAFYMFVCTSLIFSPHLQSYIVYLNFVRYPGNDLTDLRSLGLSYRTTRNILITTEDGLILKGYHLIPPLEDIRTNPLCKHLNITSDNYQNSNKSNECFDLILSRATRILLYCHGNGGTRALPMRVAIVQQMAQLLGANVITFDYRGFGDSEGWPSEYGTHLDARAAFHWIHDRLVSPRSAFIYLYGHSLGTGISSALVAEVNRFSPRAVTGLVLDCPFTSLVESSMTHPMAYPFRIFTIIRALLRRNLAFKYATIDRIHRLYCPLLLLHGKEDPKIPFEHSQLLYQAALSNPSNCALNLSQSMKIHTEGANNECHFHTALQLVPGAVHNNVYVFPEWLDSISTFIAHVEDTS
mmetsp:Transcript_6297/g.8790  ORF Transcript_6297/g.8790 Transcript_6297/m.8790 type:complete len:470 (-) Transcript_6297:86-1495(-)